MRVLAAGEMVSFSLRRVDMDFLFSPSEEHAQLRAMLRSFVSKEVEPQAIESNAQERFNTTLFLKLAKLGVLGVTVPEQYGGAGMDPLAAVIVHEELAYADAGFCLAYLAHSMLCVNNIAVNASEEQKKRLLPKLCSGAFIGAMGMSEAGAGTDVRAMSTSARKQGAEYCINGRKMWITNGVVGEKNRPCDVLLLYARSASDERGRAIISSFIIESGTQGFSVGQKIIGKLGMRSSNTAELCFDQCRVAATALVGAEGDSLLHMMRNLEIERLALAAMGLGIARRCLDAMLAYAQERKAFGKKIGEFGQIQSAIARSYAEYQSARCYVYATARELTPSSEGGAAEAVKQGGGRMNSDGVKLISAPMAKQVADRAIQVLGGNGYIEEYVVERMWRDAKLLEIGGGTLESHEKNMAKDLLHLHASGAKL